MADAPSPFAPDVAPPEQPQGGLLDRWKNFFSDQASQAALINAGAQLMQPMGFGQTPLGHLGRAIGAGGEAATRVGEMDRKASDTESKIFQREAQADTAAKRAQVAEANSNTAAARAQASIQALGFTNELNRQKALTQETLRDSLEQKANYLEQQAALFPASQEAKNAATYARAEADRAKAATMPIDTETRARRATTAEQARQDRAASDPLRGAQGTAPGRESPPRPPAAPAPSQPQTTPASAGARVPSAAAIQALVKDPSKAGDFDAYYGNGSAAKYINRGL